MALLRAAAPSPSPPPPPLPDHLLRRRRNAGLFLFCGRTSLMSCGLTVSGSAPAEELIPQRAPGWLSSSVFSVAAPAIIFLVGFGVAGSPLARACSVVWRDVPARSSVHSTENEHKAEVEEDEEEEEEEEDEDWKREFEKWKSKTYALTVPLRIVALRGSVPPSWIKDFVQIQGKRMKLIPEFRGNLDSIYSDLSSASRTGRIPPKSAMAADIVSVGDSWLASAITQRLIEPMEGAEKEDWFRSLSSKWKIYLRRNEKGEVDECGKIWAVPYRWGCMVIAYKRSKFRRHNLSPIKDWDDLWRQELRGKVVMVDSPREVVGAVLKSMGGSYNAKDVEHEVHGGATAIEQRLAALQRQVRLFDSANYLKALATGDAWVAVGWSSDVLPFAARQSDVSVIVPQSGTSLWADLWAIPAATRFPTEEKIGGRVRGPSPVVNQWIDFCLQAARARPFEQGLVPGSSPLALDGQLSAAHQGVDSGGRTEVNTNLVGGVPPAEILSKCEFLEPLAEEAWGDYKRLVAGMGRSGGGWIEGARDFFSMFLGRLKRAVHS